MTTASDNRRPLFIVTHPQGSGKSMLAAQLALASRREINGRSSVAVLRRDIAELDAICEQLAADPPQNEQAYEADPGRHFSGGRHVVVLECKEFTQDSDRSRLGFFKHAAPSAPPTWLYSRTVADPPEVAAFVPRRANGLTLEELRRPYRPAYPQPFDSSDPTAFGLHRGNTDVTAEIYAALRPFTTDDTSFGACADRPFESLGPFPELEVVGMGPAVAAQLWLDLQRGTSVRGTLLRFINAIRAALRYMLVLVLAALARCPNVPDFLLILVAALRRYGRRDDPDGHLLPARQSSSAVSGEISVR